MPRDEPPAGPTDELALHSAEDEASHPAGEAAHDPADEDAVGPPDLAPEPAREEPRGSRTPGDVAIRTRGLTKRYGDFTAVDSLDLAVRQGEVFGLLGPNGAGKTTTILMLLGLSEPSGGTARVLGLDPARNPLLVKRQVGYLPDDVGFYGGMTGRQNLRYTARLNAIDGNGAEERIARLLERVGLSDAADSPVDTYSRGMRQRLGLADVLVKDPSIVILDEPTTAIDPRGVTEVLHLVRELAQEGAAVLLSSHLLHQVQQVCDRVGIFVSGRLVAMGPMHELAEQLAGGPITFELSVGPALDEAGSAAAVERVIAAQAGVTALERDERDSRLLVVTADSDIRPGLTQALAAAGMPPIHMRRRGDELDEIYRRYFAREEAVDVRAA